MNKRIVLLFFTIITMVQCQKQPVKPEPLDTRDVLQKIAAIEGITISEIEPQNGFERQFEIFLTQPLDHNNPNGATFKQRIYLSHTNEAAPMVFMPSGYSSSPLKVAEISKPLGANQIYAAQRFMLGAEPSPMDWQYLTTEQLASDFHRIVELFKTIYPAAWISYGVSKNGQAALFHKRFYPDDVKATVAIVAPISLAREDPRYDEFLRNVGDETCRTRIKNFQRTVLKRRDDIIPLIQDYMASSSNSYTRMTAAEILEYEVLEYPFSFWQVTNGHCATVPDSSVSALALFNHIKNFGYLDFYADLYLDFFQPVYYQAYTELGWYRLIDDHLSDVLVALKNPSYSALAPRNVPLVFKPEVMLDMVQWLQTNGDNIIYIYGANDPWTAGAIELVGMNNAVKIIQPGANHSVKIADLDQRDYVYALISQWAGVKVDQNLSLFTIDNFDENAERFNLYGMVERLTPIHD